MELLESSVVRPRQAHPQACDFGYNDGTRSHDLLRGKEKF